jgi:hypothetical protein
MQRGIASRTPVSVLVLFLALGASATSCVQIEGGAVEVSWVVHANGRAITDCSCADPQIDSVRIELVGRGGNIEGATPCAGRAQCRFSCQRQTGATPFDIPETHGDERYEVSVVPVGKDGLDIPQITMPAPILRSVTRAQPTEVEAFLLEAPCAKECGGMNKSGVCTRP